MPRNFEKDFQQAVCKRKQKKNQKIVAFLFITGVLLTLAYFALKDKWTLIFGYLVNNPIILFLIFNFIVVIIFVVYLIKIQLSQKQYKSFLRFFNLDYLKRINRKYLLGYSLLLIVILYQINPSLIKNPSNNFITRLRYNPQPPISNSPWAWQEHPAIHPVVASITPDIEKSIESVAKYIAQHEADPELRIKALHDYVVSRVTYDLNVLTTGRRPPQDAKTVFKTHKAVCEGYANLFLELGRAIDIDVVFISGKVRQEFASLDLIPETLRLQKSDYNWTLHAWNAVKVKGNWQLIDTTWDDSNSSSYRTDYLMLPPQVMIVSHLPDQKDWQLLKNPKNRNSFEQQPILKPLFFAEGLTLLFPKNYPTIIQSTVSIQVQNHSNYQGKVMASFTNKESRISLEKVLSVNPLKQEKQLGIEHCQSQKNPSNITQISCHFPKPGDYQVFLFDVKQKDQSFGNYSITKTKKSFIGQLEFHSI